MTPSKRNPRPDSVPRNVGSSLDATNRAILTALTAGARLSLSELARQVGMSAPAVRERVSQLERDGVIRGYRVDIDPAAIGLPVAAWVRIKPGPQQLPKIVALAERTPQISECDRISGDDCFLMKVHVASVADLGEVLDQFLPHGQTNSSFVVSTPVAPRAPVA